MENTESVLKKSGEKVVVEVSKEIVPKEFFVDRKGLYVFSSFESNILQKAVETKEGSKFELVSFDLVESADDEKIESGLPKNHIFSETDVCAIVASLIEKQEGGKEGVLLSNGYANLFYTPSRVVGVRWRAGDGEWGVGGWGRGGTSWGAGDRVFSPATEA